MSGLNSGFKSGFRIRGSFPEFRPAGFTVVLDQRHQRVPLTPELVLDFSRPPPKGGIFQTRNKQLPALLEERASNLQKR
jgi:hypothetical protein